jgi:hypothetical protein
MKVTLCEPYFFEDPTVLVRTNPMLPGECASELVNQIVFLYIIAFVLGFATSVFMKSQHTYLIFLGIATAFVLPRIYTLVTIQKVHTVKEGFQSRPATDSLKAAGTVDVIGKDIAPAKYTAPIANNPFMNVLVDEIKYNPTKPEAVSVSGVEVATGLDEFFRTEFNRDPTDVFGRSQSQRQFITMPATTIPNDQGSYQNWLYKIPGKTCKEGGRDACLPGTDGGVMPWMNVDR